MNEDFVPYELAVKLKEKGFPQSPDYFNYISYYEWDGLRKIHSLSNASVWFDPYISKDNLCFAPTISQVLKWLREEKKLYIEIYMHHNCYLWEIYNTKIYDDVDFDQKSEKYSELEYETYELAAIAGIEYVIDNNLI